MNLPEKQQTGLLAEQDVERLMTSWGWVWGKDRIDIGYDLSVQPSHERFMGGRFHIQVKGTAKQSRGQVSAPVSKGRLREYSANVMPVFIVRVSSEGKFYWVHAQEWARSNRKKLQGNGDTVVKFEREKNLDDREEFESYLFQVMQPAAQKKGSLALLAEERSKYLNSLDEHLGVRVGMHNGSESYEVFPKSGSVEKELKFVASPKAESIDEFRDAIEFGTPASIEVDAFRMFGSKLLDEIGASEKLKGTISIQPTSRNLGTVHFCAGERYSISAKELVLPAGLFKGSKGSLVSNKEMGSLFDVSARITIENGRGRVNVTFGMRLESLLGKHIRLQDDLASVAAWAEQVIEKGAMHMRFHFHGIDAPFVIGREILEPMLPVIEMARNLGRLHLVAKALGSEMMVRSDSVFTEEDVSDINFVYALLKGDRRQGRLGPVEFEPHPGVDLSADGQFVMTTTIVFSICEQHLGEVPVSIEMGSSFLEHVEGSSRVRLIQRDGGRVWVSHQEDHSTDGQPVESGPQVARPTSNP